ncbi:MAG: hypothetical protein ACRENP_22625 [Longimicrobiales bacterium]
MTQTAPDSERVEVPADAFLRTTRQLWKLVVAALILPWPAIAIGLWIFQRLDLAQPISHLLIAIGAMAGLAALMAMMLASVRCPRCR